MSTERRAMRVQSTDWLHAAFFFVFVVVAVLTGTRDTPLFSDNQHYFFISERAAAGTPPHISHFDPKNALSMLAGAAAIRAGRWAGMDDLTATRVLSVTVGALVIALVWPLTRHITGSAAAAWVAAVALLSLERFLFQAAIGSQPKIFVVALLEMSLLALACKRTMLSGLSAAAAFLCWQPAGILLVAGPAALLVERTRLRSVVTFTATAVISIAAYEYYFFLHGALADQLEQAYLFPARYMESLPTTLAPLGRRIGWVLGVSRGVSGQSLVPLAFAVWLVAFWLGWWRKGSRIAQAFAGRADRIYFALGAHGALAICLVSYQGFPDRFILDPFMAIAAGWLAICAAEGLNTLTSRFNWHALVTAAAASILGVFVLQERWNFLHLDGLAEQRRVAAVVGKLIDAGFAVYAVGCTHLLAYNHVENFSRYGFFFRGLPEYLRDETGGRGFLPLRDGEMPDVILWSRGRYLKEQPWFARDYAKAKSDDIGSPYVQVWLRVTGRAPRFTRDSRAREVASP